MAKKTNCNNHKWIPLLGINKGKSVPTSIFTCLTVDTLPTSGPASGLIITATVDTNALGIGAPLFMFLDGHLDTADATLVATSPCVALAVDAGTGSKRVLIHGILRRDAWNWTIGPGTSSLIYLSTTTGTLTQTPISDIENNPPTADKVIQPVGWALSADCIYFAPSMIYLTHI